MATSVEPAPSILLFLKAPVPGTVKTRIARTLGDKKATAIYRALVERQLANVPRSWPVEIHFSPAGSGDEMRGWLGNQFHYEPQSSGDLGERLLCGIHSAFDRGATATFAIGGDCPNLQVSHFLQARELLTEGNDVVFGPAVDGGYYLIAAKQPFPVLFRSIAWSTSTVLEKSLQAAHSANLSTALLSVENDIDEAADWERIQDQFPRV